MADLFSTEKHVFDPLVGECIKCGARYLPATETTCPVKSAHSYMLFDSRSANAIDFYDNLVDAYTGLCKIVGYEASAADELSLIGCDEKGMPMGEAITYRSNDKDEG